MKYIYVMLLSMLVINLSGCDDKDKQKEENLIYPKGLQPIEKLDFGKTFVPLGQESSGTPETHTKK